MKLYKITITGNDTDFAIRYTSSTNFVTYNDCQFTGTEQEKYSQFLAELQKNAGEQTINIKVKMTNKTIDRAFTKSVILGIKDVGEFIQRLGA
ncbi:hypothetical protein P22_3830 [Propionispora sp. 2/2-37]|uniref:hypothetical protein n=1 Tax=Propionispora sp. 2/2-37 TaxID=1677858 RepID=UPI0006BB7B39|nr:hypothetical protein [Propionispora sp. 2/2-37]CUH97695.1 hypothetical protein P22_3830 [Propionispora sp. 2/2-37]